MTREERQIPKAVMEMADKQSCNKVVFVGHINEYGDIFAIWEEDENGLSIPLGLPVYIFQRGTNLTLFEDVDFKITDLLNL